jgi:hypothetical protein
MWVNASLSSVLRVIASLSSNPRLALSEAEVRALVGV